MSVEVVGGTIRIIGNATVADAEPLLVALQGDPARHIDLGQAVHLHSAVIQILLALRPRIIGNPAYPFFNDCILPRLIEASVPHSPPG
ncbi:hypothetical protein [Sphingomonas sp. MMS24-J13]|uniref:hypothetical protein n=1 Tax=Sphingomonas sp. MMS24-J13 TaxID=3238686 RepID=UPI0038511BB8